MAKRGKMSIKIVARNDKNTDLQFWLKKTPEERIEAVEFLRSQYYALAGYKSVPRIVPEITIRPLHSLH
jgi:hypothetical protein